jgi:uncharacterized membrane protein HdeD (DUF308 family)
VTLPVSASVSATRYWIVALARAVVALAAAAFITFSADHSAELGLLVFGSCALVSGLVTAVGAFTVADRVLRNVILVQGVFGVAGGILALVLHSSGLGVLLYTVSVWAALTGFAELYCGIRARGRAAMSRDWLIVGGLTAVLALVYLVIPADPVLAVGLFGAYAVVVGVYQAIGAFSLKWSAVAHDTVETHA